MLNDEHLLTIEEVAERLRVSERTVRQYVHDNRLRAVKLGDGDKAPVRIAPSELERFVNKGAKRGFAQGLRRAIDERKSTMRATA